MRRALILFILLIGQISYGAHSDNGLVERIVGLGDHNLNIRCQGSGRPTVILEAGSGTDLKTWASIQPEIAEFTRVCSYSRAGVGQSTLPTDAIQLDAVATVKDLHDVLQNPMIKANSPPPYILVGHSYGGLYTQFFLDAHPNEVAGMVLLDATSGNMGMKGFDLSDSLVDQLIIYSTKKNAYLKKHPGMNERTLQIISARNESIVASIKDERLPIDFIKTLHELRKMENADMDKLEKIKRRDKFLLGDKPLFVIVSGRHEMIDFFKRFRRDKNLVSKIISNELRDEFEKMLSYNIKDSLKNSYLEKESVLSLSRNNVLKIAQKSGHSIHKDQPKLVVDAIKRCISSYRVGNNR